MRLNSISFQIAPSFTREMLCPTLTTYTDCVREECKPCLIRWSGGTLAVLLNQTWMVGEGKEKRKEGREGKKKECFHFVPVLSTVHTQLVSSCTKKIRALSIVLATPSMTYSGRMEGENTRIKKITLALNHTFLAEFQCSSHQHSHKS